MRIFLLTTLQRATIIKRKENTLTETVLLPEKSQRAAQAEMRYE